MKAYILKFKYDTKEAPQIIGVFSTRYIVKNFIDGNKYKERYQGGGWVVSDHEIDRPEY
jgi:hypothetical protein